MVFPTWRDTNQPVQSQKQAIMLEIRDCTIRVAKTKALISFAFFHSRPMVFPRTPYTEHTTLSAESSHRFPTTAFTDKEPKPGNAQAIRISPGRMGEALEGGHCEIHFQR